MGTKILAGMTAAALLFAGLSGCQTDNERAEADAMRAVDDGVPQYEVDPFWPQQLPDNWLLGQVAGLAVDRDDHIWIFQRPASLTEIDTAAAQVPQVSACCRPAPEVIQFAPDGSVVRAWDASNVEGVHVETPHGIYPDQEGNIWLGDAGSHQVLKYSADGEFLLRIGEQGRTGGSGDTGLLGGPADMLVDPDRNELFVVDGYDNRRVIVFDTESGEYLRHWGAYGESPDDEPLDPYDPENPDASEFRGPVHGIVLSEDGMIYVADRAANRIQVFDRDGTFIEEAFVRPETLEVGSTWDLALSEDPGQRWLYAADGMNNRVWILDRESLETRGHFGHGGKNAGQFGWIHNVDLDSRGNLFTSEVEEGKRVQRFVRRE